MSRRPGSRTPGCQGANRGSQRPQILLTDPDPVGLLLQVRGSHSTPSDRNRRRIRAWGQKVKGSPAHIRPSRRFSNTPGPVGSQARDHGWPHRRERGGSIVPPGSCDFDCSATSYLVHAPSQTLAKRSNTTRRVRVWCTGFAESLAPARGVPTPPTDVSRMDDQAHGPRGRR